MTKKLTFNYCPTESLWKKFIDGKLYKHVRVCLEKIDILFGQKDYSKPLIISFSDKPSKKKGEKPFDCFIDRYCISLYYKKKYISTYNSLSKWIKLNFPHLKTKDKLYVRASQ